MGRTRGQVVILKRENRARAEPRRFGRAPAAQARAKGPAERLARSLYLFIALALAGCSAITAPRPHTAYDYSASLCAPLTVEGHPWGIADADARIQACSARLSQTDLTNEQQAAVLDLRAIFYLNKSDVARAMTDFDKAISIAPL